MAVGELAVALAGLQEGSPAAKALAAKVERAFRDAAPAQRETTRLLLEALAQARWHQDAALADLTPEERAALLAADPSGAEGATDLLARVDAAEVQQAMAILAAALQELAQAPASDPPLTLSQALADAVGTRTAGREPPSGAANLARSLDLLLGDGAGAAALPELRELPAPVRAALADVLAGGEEMLPMEDREDALARLAARVDRARPVLEAWSLLVRLQHLEESAGAAPLPPVDPDAAAPGLRSGALGPLALAPPPSLEEALARAAAPLGLPAPVVPATGLPPAQERALATFFDAVGAYEEALLGAALVGAAAPAVPDLTAALDLLEEDEWPADDPRLADLLAAAPTIEAQHRLLQAQDALLGATEALVPAFSVAAAMPAPCTAPPVVLPPLLQLDSCGTETFADSAVLTLDLGGDDHHTQRVGAPFTLRTSAAAQREVGVPVTVLLDLAGNDTYVAMDDCALAAACPQVPDLDHTLPQDAWRLQPVAVLVDWAGNGTTSRNEFLSGNRSQGYAADHHQAYGASDLHAYYRPYAALVEHAGSDARLDSAYTAGNLSQGSATAALKEGEAQGRPSGSVGLLLRTVGSRSHATASFTAHDNSQGSHRGASANRGAVLGALVNAAGQDAVHTDAYSAGKASQGAAASLGALANPAALGLLADWAGPGSSSSDTYQAGDGSRGATPRPAPQSQVNSLTRADGTPVAGALALFMDALAPAVPVSATVSDDLGQAEVRPATTLGVSDDRYDRVARGNGHAVGLFLDLQGRDEYGGDPLRGDDRQWQDPPQTAGGPTWQPLAPLVTGADAGGTTDVDADGMPSTVEAAWQEFVGLWDAADDDEARQPSPVHPSVLIDHRGTGLHLDRPYGLVVSVAGDDTYGPAFRATVHLDLDGNDLYLGPTAAASLLPPGTVAEAVDALPDPAGLDGASSRAAFDPAALLPGIDPRALPLAVPVPVDLPVGGVPADALPAPLGGVGGTALGLAGLGPEPDAGAEAAAGEGDEAGTPAPPSRRSLVESPAGTGPQPAAGPRGLALHLDLQGDDTYASAQSGVQGFGRGRAAGLLLDLSGSDAYAAPRAAQGVGMDGGLGVLVDLGPDGANSFYAQQPAHGSGHGLGGVGLFIVEGRHNQAPDGGDAGEDVRPGANGGEADGGVGASLNVATEGNGAPSILGNTTPTGPFLAGASHPFAAEVADPEGDRLEVCWLFEAGAGPETRCATVQPDGSAPVTAQVDYAWTSVPTDSSVAGQEESLVFGARVEVRDPGGRSATLDLGDFEVVNPPPRFLAPGVRGPRDVLLPDSGAREAAYQPVLEAADWATAAAFQADWGDGGSSEPAPAEPVDWLRDGRGASLPDVVVSDGMAMADCLTDLSKAFDSLDHTFLVIAAGLGCPMVHAIVDLPEPRRVTQVRLAATVSGSTRPMKVSIEAVTADGGVLPLHQATVSRALEGPDTEPQEIVVDLPGGADVVGVQVRQLSAPRAQVREELQVHALEAFGPGLLHTWRAPGAFPVAIAAIDQYGGRSLSRLQVDVEATAEGQRQVPLELVDVSGRGPARHVSVAVGPVYTVAFRVDRADPLALACLDWGDGSAAQCLEPLAGQYLYFRHAWRGEEAAEHQVSLEYLLDGRSVAQQPVALVDAAPDRVDLFLHTADLLAGPQAEGGLVSPALPRALGLVFVDGGARTTWHSAPYAGVVDAGGDDRYSGRIAAAVAPADAVEAAVQRANPGQAPTPWPTNLGAMPALLVDQGGDDDYLANTTGTQGFAAGGGAALLADLGGDDVYVAAGSAQGAASNAGFAALLDLGGTDWFNPVHPEHPDVLRGLASNASAWTERPAALQPLRAPAALGPDHVQGSSREGVGVLVLGPGTRILHAGRDSQAHGRHLVASAGAYVLPDPEPCGSRQDVTVDLPGNDDPSVEAPATPDPANPLGAFDEVPLCSLGMRGWRLRDVGSGLTLPLPDDISRFNDFVQQRGRYGPGLGVLANLGGGAIATGHGGQAMAGPSGRALLANAAGALVAVSAAGGQALAEGGQAALASTGATVLRLRGGDGQGDAAVAEQAPDLADEPIGLLAVRGAHGSDVACDACSGTATPLPEPAGAPGLAWESLPAALTADSSTLLVRVQPAAELPSPAYIEVFAVGVPRPWAAGGACTPGGATLGAPVRLFHDRAPAGATSLVPIKVDLAATLGDGPLLPASCLELVVMARHVAGAAATDWRVEKEARPALAPPAVRLNATRAVGQDADVLVPVHVHQPAAAAAPSQVKVEYAVLPVGSSPSAATVPQEVTAWQPMPNGTGAIGQLTWAVAGKPTGEYRAWTRSTWTLPGAVLGPWTQQPTVFLLDRTPPLVESVTLPGAAPAGDGKAVRLGRGVTVHGTAADGQGIAAVEARLLDAATGAALPVVGDADGVVAATLEPIDGQRSSWNASLVPVLPFAGGWTHLEVRAIDGAGAASPWQQPAGKPATRIPVLLDGGAPFVTAVELAGGGNATNSGLPLDLVATVEDPGIAFCATACGVGVGPSASLLAVVVHSGGVIPLEATGPEKVGGAYRYSLRWEGTGDGTPPPALYRVRVQVADLVGNVGLHEVGTDLHVDRAAPRLENLQVAGGPAVRPGQQLQVSVEAFDPSGGAGILGVTAGLLGEATPLAKGSGAAFGGTVTVPDAGGLPAVRAVPLQVGVSDRAGNVDLEEHVVQFHAANFEVGVDPRLRSDAITLNLTVADRAVSLASHQLRLKSGGPALVPLVTPIEDGLSLAYSGLAADTAYTFTGVLRDAAGWERTVLRELTTPLASDGAIALDPLPSVPVSTKVRVSGNVTLALVADVVLTLHVGTASSPAQDTMSLADVTEARPFVLEWTPPDDFVGEVPLFLRLDDGDRVGVTPATVLVDTRDPSIGIRLTGNRGADGWFTSPVLVQPLVEDDSEPTAFTLRGESRSTITIDTEGRHEVTVAARDGALPPNEATATVEVKYDRTPPAMKAALDPADDAQPFAFQRFTGCSADATCWWSIPLDVQADDPVSGVDAFRLSVAGTESEWQRSVPRVALLNTSQADGEYALRVTVRDRAGNLDSTTVTFTLDTAPPHLLAARWVGRTSNGTGILHVVGLDELTGSAQRPSGVQAVRFAAGDSGWSSWIPTDGNDAVEVPGGLANGASVTIQLRDRAGNVGTADVVEPLPPPTLNLPPQVQAPPSAALLETPRVTPEAGDERTPFAFSVVAGPALGQPPSAVWVEVDGVRHPMEASGPARSDGGQLYTVSLDLEATRLHEPHVHRFIAAYGATEVATEPQAGPLVSRAPSGEPAPAADAATEEAPFPATLALAALAAAALARRGWRRR